MLFTTQKCYTLKYFTNKQCLPKRQLHYIIYMEQQAFNYHKCAARHDSPWECHFPNTKCHLAFFCKEYSL